MLSGQDGAAPLRGPLPVRGGGEEPNVPGPGDARIPGPGDARNDTRGIDEGLIASLADTVLRRLGHDRVDSDTTDEPSRR